MSNYEQLIQKLNNQNDEIKGQALKKLIYLAVNDHKNFIRYSLKIVQFINGVIEYINNEDTKLLSLQLLSQLVTNYKNNISKTKYQFDKIIIFLSDQKPEIRKASHYLLLTFVKKYEKLDEILKSYQQIVARQGTSWKLMQKIIHSFQSLIVVEPKCIIYSEDYTIIDKFIDFLFTKIQGQNNLLKKASEQAIVSFMKNQYLPEIVHQLQDFTYKKLKDYAILFNIVLIEKNSPYLLESQQYNQEEETLKKKKSLIIYDKVQIAKTNEKNIQTKKQLKFVSEKQLHFQTQQSPSQIYANNMYLNQLIHKMDAQNQWSIKCSAVQQTLSFLQVTKINQVPPLLLERVIDLTFDFNFKTCLNSLNILHHLICGYYDYLTEYLKKIEDVLIEKMCDMKVAIRQISSKIIKQIFNKGNSSIIKGLLQKLNNCSIVGKQQILNLMQELYTNQFQDSYTYVIGEISSLMYNENTRLKIKAIDCIVKITINTNVQTCKKILSKKLNKVYYDMFVQRLKQNNNQKSQQKIQITNIQLQKAPSNNFTKNKQEFKFFDKSQEQVPIKKQEQMMIRRDQAFYQTKSTSKSMNTTNTQSLQNNLKKQKNIKNINNFGDIQNTDEKLKLIITNTTVRTKNEQQVKNEQIQQKQKSYQYKPTLSKKITRNTQSQTQLGKQQLIILSKQYQYKNPNNVNEQIKEQKQEKKNFKLNTKPFINKKPTLTITNQQQEEYHIEQPKQIFKKSTKQETRTIDYKATQYLAKQQLQPSNDPQKILKILIIDIKKQDDWSKQFEALNHIRRILKHHPQMYNGLNINMGIIIPQVMKLIESLRSSLAKNAMITFVQMCQCLRKVMDNHLELIFQKLFKKSLDTNVFITEQVKKCLIYLCNYCNVSKIITIVINSCQTKQAQVKMNILLVFQRLISRAPNKLMFLKQNNKIVNILGTYIIDSSFEVRNYDKSIFIGFAKELPKAQIQNLLKRNMNEQCYLKFKNILEKQVVKQQIFIKYNNRNMND